MFLRLVQNLVVFNLLLLVFSSAFGETTIQRKMYNPWEKEIGYSQVVIAGNHIYLSGIASNKPSLKEQVREIYSLIQNTLKDNNLGMNNIVKQVIYTTDIEAYKKLGKVRKELFNDDQYPSSTLVEVQRLYSPNHMVEIEVVAFKDE